MREMKDDIWFGSLPEHWVVGRIGKLYTERKTKVSDVDYAPLSVTKMGVVPQLATAAKTDAHDDRKLVLKGDFAINSRSDRRGSCGISDYNGSVSLINTILTPREEMDPGYYNWLFHTAEFADEFYKWGHGIVDDLWTTNWSDMKRIAVPVPSHESQRRIAKFLDAKCAEIDAVMEKTLASIEEYKKLKQAVITEAVTKGIRGNRPMKDSGVEWIGDIPHEWGIYRKLSFLCDDSISYGIIKLYDPDEQGVPVLRCSDVKAGFIDSSSIRTVSKALSDEYKRTILKGGEVVINVRGTLGGCAIVPESMCGYNVAREVAVIRASRINSRYLMYYLLSDAFLSYQQINLSGSVYVGLNIELLSSCPIVSPPEKEQQEIVAYLDEKCAAIDSLIASKEALITELEAYRKSIIYEYVTGKKEG